ncbi:MAG: DNA-3-methyladenine glycosylase 2 family protein [Burkholderiaceae bacterium]|jgi:DNA-3-methyladenine glycosylase II|uniref:DNA-3-methyladenine glycosylase family protein n=1 Tax=Polynucleobacter sp. MWH-Loch1C5 TaxID=2689108 RepID=UPI001C0C5646|nr:DNA-3-methyladenine glycosylase 2 family protein [Polynucleobacter sp. MWH-Loch1C5]MBU3543080.1 DNA-3-methyladenine glycosylase 2 family protein [Polynucleobacter sp. MWH-Loch1C5]NBV01232.1 DNA-3-methyladenine glycosylase 2 family protein [Burkholderiaceae bacterium]
MPAVKTSAVLAAPDYWQTACTQLMKQDRILRKLIPKYPQAEFLTTRGDPFQTLARAIVGQQISVKAAQSVWDRLLETNRAQHKHFNAKNILQLEPSLLRAAGLSTRKVEYMRDLANHFENGGLGHAQWDQLDDETVIKELVAIRGIGRWTAEMFLIFYLMRPNVLPLDDIGLIRGISLAYFSGEPVTRSEAKEVAANWEPWKTVATWYMWRSIDPIPVEY